MADEIMKWCDWHLTQQDEKVPGIARRVHLEGSKQELVDLCDPCDKEFLGPIRELLESIGRKPDQANPPLNSGAAKRRTRRTAKDASEDEMIPCPHRGCKHKTLVRSSMNSHTANAHDTALAVYEGKRGKTITGETVNFYCDHCPAGFVKRNGKTWHEKNAHEAQGTLTA